MNKENYKNAINQIHATDELKKKTFEKIQQESYNKEFKRSFLHFRQLSTICAVCMVMFFVFTFYLKDNDSNNLIDFDKNLGKEVSEVVIPRFESVEQLKEVLKKNREESYKGDLIIEDSISIGETNADTNLKEDLSNNRNDHSETNVQVEGVNEADIIKTDGRYIYYVANNKVYIFDAENLKVLSEIESKNDNEKFYPREIYIKENRLIILGNSTIYRNQEENDIEKNIYYGRIDTNYMAKAIIYDISNKEQPKELRQVAIDGNYNNSRMIGDNIYFISNKYVYYNSNLKDEEILPIYTDTVSELQEERIKCTDIAYFRDTNNCSYMLVAGFNINNNDKVNIETFFGANDTVYCSKNNLYMTQTIYREGFFTSSCKSAIYKFKIDNSKIELQCKGEVNGDLNDQFSIDEYEGNLRIATTNYVNGISTNQLFILDENLKEIGKVDKLAKGEQIYSVRFVGKIGYVVTFKEIDPLFVIDLSDPTNPKVKGKLKIPGYSSYLHPYDENHIIGIGYNTKSNGYGGVTNSNMKMSMFDVSDLENPKELFHIDIGDDYAYSEIINNHKALFYHKDKNLIGFPVESRNNETSNYNNGFVIFKVDLEEGFKKYGEITKDANYQTDVKRVIYIGNVLYTLSSSNIISYNLTDLKKINEINFD